MYASEQALEDFTDDVSSLWCAHSIAVLDEPPSPLRFLRDFVSLSRPCIIKNTILHEEKSLMLTLDELVARYPKMELTVDVTPDGHGDCLRQVEIQDQLKTIFVTSEERRMTLESFRDQLRHATPVDEAEVRGRVFQATTGDEPPVAARPVPTPGVVYYSRQNDCLRQELSPFWEAGLFPDTIPWAQEAFGTGGPDVVNLWIGNECAVSSMHKDHYENLFYVLEGQKVFTMCPPADAPFLYEREVESGAFVTQNGEWEVRVETDSGGNTSSVRWVMADVTQQTDQSMQHRFPRIRRAHPTQVCVNAGEMLYLPALWFHRVTQSCETVAVNYWYDMRFDSPNWCYFNFLQQLR